MSYGNESHGHLPQTPASPGGGTSNANAANPNQGGWVVNESEGMPGDYGMGGGAIGGAQDGDYCNTPAQAAFNAQHGRPAGTADPEVGGSLEGTATAGEGAAPGPVDY